MNHTIENNTCLFLNLEYLNYTDTEKKHLHTSCILFIYMSPLPTLAQNHPRPQQLQVHVYTHPHPTELKGKHYTFTKRLGTVLRKTHEQIRMNKHFYNREI